MIKFTFNKIAQKLFLKLSSLDQERVRNKLTQLKNHENIFTVLVKLKNFTNATHRIRIGNLRLVLLLKHQEDDNIEFTVIKIGHRREIYK